MKKPYLTFSGKPIKLIKHHPLLITYFFTEFDRIIPNFYRLEMTKVYSCSM